VTDPAISSFHIRTSSINRTRNKAPLTTNAPSHSSIALGTQRAKDRSQLFQLLQPCSHGIYQLYVQIHITNRSPVCEDALTDAKALQHDTEVSNGTITIIQEIGVKLFKLWDGFHLVANHFESFILVYPFSIHLYFICFIIYTTDNTLLHYICFVLFFLQATRASPH
jgi:hypothetical protein